MDKQGTLKTWPFKLRRKHSGTQLGEMGLLGLWVRKLKENENAKSGGSYSIVTSITRAHSPFFCLSFSFSRFDNDPQKRGCCFGE
jgi:hypothetical protein